jgi:hypothetical protein
MPNNDDLRFDPSLGEVLTVIVLVVAVLAAWILW